MIGTGVVNPSVLWRAAAAPSTGIWGIDAGGSVADGDKTSLKEQC
jgi:hypothetical protein